jgi:hypothetical protein
VEAPVRFEPLEAVLSPLDYCVASVYCAVVFAWVMVGMVIRRAFYQSVVGRIESEG